MSPPLALTLETYLEPLGVTTASALIWNLPIFIAAPEEFCMKGLGEDFRRQILKINHQSRGCEHPKLGSVTLALGN